MENGLGYLTKNGLIKEDVHELGVVIHGRSGEYISARNIIENSFGVIDY